jgi:DNA-binding NtrC family response regulator
MVVEDEAGVRGLVTGLLRQQGYTVLEAASSAEALALAESTEGRIDLLVTDMVMPRMNGAELARRMTGMRLGLRTLYMSGYTDHALVTNHMLRPDMCFLHKPFTPLELGRKVRDLLDAVEV